jgi:wyosine [tRNA(Phe)-imidazoG37] synthetase (radical SAM superfamily)
MFDPLTWPAERNNTLSLGDLIRVLDSFCEFEQKLDVDIDHFAISGGDPLLRKDWKEFISELRKRGKTVSMMGNPETLTDANIAALVELGRIISSAWTGSSKPTTVSAKTLALSNARWISWPCSSRQASAAM